MNHVDQVVATLRVDTRQVLGDHHRSVPATGAADADRQVGLALLLVGGQQVVEQRGEPVVEGVDAVRVLDVIDHGGVQAGQVPQLRLVVGIGQETDVEGQVGVARRAVLEAEGEERERQLADAPVGKHLVGDDLSQPGGREVAGVDRDVRLLVDGGEQLALLADRLAHLAALCQRMAPAGLLEAVDEHLLRGLQVEQPEGELALLEPAEHLHQPVEELAAAHVADHGGALHLAALVAEQVGQRADHLRRQVVDAEVARVLEAGHRLGLARAREAGDDDEVAEHRYASTLFT